MSGVSLSPMPQHGRAFAVGLARAFAGALIFALPMLMTMEMWYLGFYIDRLRLVLLLVITVPLLVGLSYYSGFEETRGIVDDIRDAFAAFAVATVAAALILFIFDVIRPGLPLDEIIGKVALQAVPASIGALLARSQMSGDGSGQGDEKDKRKRRPSYLGELFLMGVGALFLAFNVAPTEEMVLIAYQMMSWHGLALILLSLLLMHAFVYAVEFRGQEVPPEQASFWGVVLRFSVTGYAIALLTSLYMLWTFGRTDGLEMGELLMTVIVLGFPAAIGAAAARLII